MAGIFITFEGIDGCGKSTQLRMLASALRLRSHDVITTREPGGTSFGKRLRAALLDIRETVDPLSELLLFAADRAQHVRTLLVPALEAGKIVISDRYADSTIVYQGCRGFDRQILNQVITLATEGLTPDLTFLLDISPSECRRRMESSRTGRRANDRFDNESLAWHERLHAFYRQRAQEEPERIRLIDASADIDTVHRRIMEVAGVLVERQAEELHT